MRTLRVDGLRDFIELLLASGELTEDEILRAVLDCPDRDNIRARDVKDELYILETAGLVVRGTAVRGAFQHAEVYGLTR